MTTIEFQAPFFLLLPVLLLLIYFFAEKFNWINRDKIHQSNTVSIYIPLLIAPDSKAQHRRFGSAVFINWFLVILLSIALAQPVAKEKITIRSDKTQDIFFVVDVSVGMSIDDYTLDNTNIDRLTYVKLLLQDFITKLGNNRIGTMVYADEAYILTPLTSDKQLVSFNINRIRPALAGRRNNLGNALNTLKSRLLKTGSKPTVIVLSQGANLEKSVNLEKVINEYRNLKIRLHFIGLGAQSGKSETTSSSLIYESIDKTLLTKLSSETGGQFFWAGISDELKSALSVIRNAETTQLPDRDVYKIRHYYFWFIYAFILIVIVRKILDVSRVYLK